GCESAVRRPCAASIFETGRRARGRRVLPIRNRKGAEPAELAELLSGLNPEDSVLSALRDLLRLRGSSPAVPKGGAGRGRRGDGGGRRRRGRGCARAADAGLPTR